MPQSYFAFPSDDNPPAEIESETREVGTKFCRCCQTLKPRSAFHRLLRAGDGLQGKCKECQKNKVLSKAPKSPNIGRPIVKRHYHRNRDREIARVLRWRKLHAESLRVYSRAYLKATGKGREFNHNRRARKRAAVRVKFTTAQLRAKVAYWGERCWMCGGPFEAIDHVKPLTKGGLHCLANLRPSCASCNSQKRNKWPFSPPNPPTRLRPNLP